MKLPFGGETPFSAEVWYVNKAVNLSLPWGTPDPIQLEDPKYQVMIPVRAFGQYGVQVKDSKKFLLKLVGTLRGFDVDTLQNYFAGIFTTTIKQLIAATIIEAKVSVLEIAPHLDKLSQELLVSLTPALDDYGLSLSQFNINSINVPEEDPAVIQLKAALAKRAELGILGFTYQQDRSFDVLETAAGNEGGAGQVLGEGLGLGLGVGIGGTMGQMVAPGGVMNTNAATVSATPIEPSATEKIELLKQLAELKNSGALTEEEFAEAKRKLLA
jgi:membrane protease subunit (stomatin/prohibitin family)